MSTTPALATADELFVMPDDGFRYELVRGNSSVCHLPVVSMGRSPSTSLWRSTSL